jgi:hypothetical protein
MNNSPHRKVISGSSTPVNRVPSAGKLAGASPNEVNRSVSVGANKPVPKSVVNRTAAVSGKLSNKVGKQLPATRGTANPGKYPSTVAKNPVKRTAASTKPLAGKKRSEVNNQDTVKGSHSTNKGGPSSYNQKPGKPLATASNPEPIQKATMQGKVLKVPNKSK